VVLKIIQTHGDAQSLVSACYGPGTPQARRQESTVLPLTQGIAYEAYVTQDLAFSNDISHDARFYPQKHKEEFLSKYLTVVACPVMVNRQVLAILCFDWKESGVYQKKYREVFACFTDVISTACYICHESRNVKPSKQEAA
jgi:signal transduction protein with GAF and PtsI domain